MEHGRVIVSMVAIGIGLAPLYAQGTSVQTAYGFHQDLDYFGGTSMTPRVDLIKSIDAKSSRSTFRWHLHEPSPGVFDWTRTDEIMAKLQAEGIKPVWYIGSSPQWANNSTDRWVVPSYPSSEFTYWSDRLALFAAAAATRYPGQMWEIWNEPNEIYFWKPTPTRPGYSEMYLKVRSAMLAADPTAKIAVGGITGLNAGCCINGFTFIQQMLQNGDPIDYLAIHPYAGGNQAPENCMANQRQFRDIAYARKLLSNYGNNAPIWITEWGWQSSASLGQTTQADYLTRGHEMLQTGKMKICPQRSPMEEEVDINVTVSTWFFDIDTSAYPNAGVFTINNSRKLAATAFEDFMASINPTKTTSTGLLYSRATGTFNGTVYIQNLSSEPAAGPLRVEFSDLPAGVTLANATGSWANGPYIELAELSLAPGQTATIPVRFANPSNKAISFVATTHGDLF